MVPTLVPVFGFAGDSGDKNIKVLKKQKHKTKNSELLLQSFSEYKVKAFIYK